MDELYLDNIDEFVNDHNKIVRRLLIFDVYFIFGFINCGLGCENVS